MSLTGRAWRVARGMGWSAATAAGLYGAGYGLIRAEGLVARRIVGQPFGSHGPEDDGRYGSAPGAPIEIVVLGDSSAAGLGCESPNQTVGAIIATGIAAISGRPVELINEAVVGARSADLDRQLALALARCDQPDVALIMIGGNDVTGQVPKLVATRQLAQTVRHLRALDIEGVVGTCPDLGTIRPIPYPLKNFMRHWSRSLAAAQTVAVVEAGGRTVSLNDLLGVEFSASPSVMFSEDRFHPSAAGYARVASALLPSVAACLGLHVAEADADAGSTPRVRQLRAAAHTAALHGGVEVTSASEAGRRGPAGRWAAQLRQGPWPRYQREPAASLSAREQ